ncbi:hypothetical protein BDD12DRAFT_843354 [Trichophaea hybrida]|nr:hypothetical protein BDD12DRAFT_843354 [Trichophaea hybrida]
MSEEQQPRQSSSSSKRSKPIQIPAPRAKDIPLVTNGSDDNGRRSEHKAPPAEQVGAEPGKAGSKRKMTSAVQVEIESGMDVVLAKWIYRGVVLRTVVDMFLYAARHSCRSLYKMTGTPPTVKKMLFLTHLLIPKSQALKQFDWLNFNELMGSPITEPGTISWARLAIVLVIIVTLARQAWKIALRLVNRTTGTIPPQDWRITQRITREAAQKYEETNELLKQLRKRAELLEKELGEAPTKKKIAQWKKAVVDLPKQEKKVAELRKQLQEAKATIQATPSGSSTSEEVANLLQTVQKLQKELNDTKNLLAAAVSASAPSRVEALERPSRFVIPDPQKFDGSKPSEFFAWKKAVLRKIEGDEIFFRNQDTMWEYLCGRTSGKVMTHMRNLEYERLIKDVDLNAAMGNSEDNQISQIIKGFFDEIFHHFGNYTEQLELNDQYQKCTQGKRTFQEYYRQLFMLANKLGYDTESKAFKLQLEYNTADYLKRLVIGKTYDTVAEAVENLLYVDACYRFYNGGDVHKTEEVRQVKSQEEEKNPEKITMRKVPSEMKRKGENGKFKDTPCRFGDKCYRKDNGCWWKH